MVTVLFRNRTDAGRALASGLEFLRESEPIVLGLPRGGVPVAAEVADRLGAPLDVILVRKLGAPGHPEYAFGAIGEGGVRVLDPSAVRMLGITEAAADDVEQRERDNLDRLAAAFRGSRTGLDPTGRTAIIVDDGIATGSTAQAACRVARARGVWRVVLATPVAPPEVAARLAASSAADDTIVAETPSGFLSVGQWYTDFSQTTDAEVTALLTERRSRES